jgi:hypothetical protein
MALAIIGGTVGALAFRATFAKGGEQSFLFCFKNCVQRSLIVIQQGFNGVFADFHRVSGVWGLEGNGAGKVAEVVEHVSVAKINADNHILDSFLLVGRSLNHGLHKAINGNEVRAGFAFDGQGVVEVDLFFVNEGEEPVFEVHGVFGSGCGYGLIFVHCPNNASGKNTLSELFFRSGVLTHSAASAGLSLRKYFGADFDGNSGRLCLHVSGADSG